MDLNEIKLLRKLRNRNKRWERKEDIQKYTGCLFYHYINLLLFFLLLFRVWDYVCSASFTHFFHSLLFLDTDFIVPQIFLSPFCLGNLVEPLFSRPAPFSLFLSSRFQWFLTNLFGSAWITWPNQFSSLLLIFLTTGYFNISALFHLVFLPIFLILPECFNGTIQFSHSCDSVEIIALIYIEQSPFL